MHSSYNRLMSAKILSLIFLILSLLLPMRLVAAPVVLDKGIGRYDLGFSTEYFEDKKGSYSIEQLLSPEGKVVWTPNDSATPNFAFSRSVYWLRVQITASQDFQHPLLFEIAFPLQDYIDYYLVENGVVIEKIKTGDRLGFDSRPIAFRNYLFPLEVRPGASRQIYLRLDTNDGLHEPVPMILWSERQFTLEYGVRNLGLGLYFGIMLVMALYNLFVFLSVKDKAYLYYVAYILGFTFWLFTYYGFAFQYLWPNSPNWANQSTVVLTALWSMFVLQFVRYFLDTKHLMRWFEVVGKTFLVCMSLTIVVSFYGNYSLGIFSVILFGSVTCLLGIVAGFISWRRGYRPARYFLLAWSVLLIFLVVFCLKIAGVLPPVWFIERSVQIGSTIEVIFLSLGLADRINTLKKEKMVAQEESIKAYESSLQLKNDFITTISHELRTPMNAILGGVEVAQKKHSEEADPALEIIHSGAKDMMALVGDILIHTELQSGQLAMSPSDIELRSVLQQIVNPTIEMSDAKGLTFSLDIKDDVPDWIVTDQNKLSVLLSKLLSNAVKFTDQGKIVLDVAMDKTVKPHQLMCRVLDTGSGIPEERQGLIFDPFVQAEGGFTRRHGGVGIGLSICKRLTDALHGSLTVSSQEGEGSEFTLRLPVEEGASPQPHESVLHVSAKQPVLVVEDNLVNQKVIVKMLAKLGYQSLVANQGQEALDVLEKHAVSLILMDLQMPVMDGFSCAQAIRAGESEYKNIPIIAVTANVMDVDKKRCFECGMNEFLEKPVKLKVLRESLLRYMQE